MLKLDFRKITYDMLLIYPLLNFLFCWWNKGDNMNVFSCLFCLFFLLCFSVKSNMKKTQKNLIWLVVVGFMDIVIAVMREAGTAQLASSMLFMICILMLFVYSDSEMEIEYFRQIIKKRKGLIHTVNICFVLLMLRYVNLYGLRAGWNTWVLQGPYNYPHTLSYLLLFMILQELYLFMDEKDKISAVILIIFAVMLFFTAVRSAILAALVAVCYMMYHYLDTRHFKQLLFIGAVFFLLYSVFYERGVFESLIRKTEQAISHGSVSNGRAEIALSSLGALKENKRLGFVFGVGMSELLRHNLYTIRAGIHAHNDLVDALVCYGMISLLAYLYSFYLFIKKNKIWNGVLLGILILFNGLFMYVDCLPMLVYSRILFEGTTVKRSI